MADHHDHVHVPYDEGGGFIPPGRTWARNDTGQPEQVLTERELREPRDGEVS